MNSMIKIRPVEYSDAETITEIYNHYITNTTVSFETEPLTISEMSCRIKEISTQYPYFVAEQEGRVVGYCYVHQWKEREAYSHTFEVTIYLAPQSKGQGIGSIMLRHLIEVCKTMKSCHALISCITEENKESIEFHKHMGFEIVSHFKDVGYKFDRWLNVVDMEMLI